MMGVASMEPLRTLFNKAVTSKKKPERQSGASEFAAEANKVGLTMTFEALSLNTLLAEEMAKNGKKASPNREGAVYIAAELCASSPAASLLLIPSISQVFHLVGDKQKPVGAGAKIAADAIIAGCTADTVAVVVPELLKKIESFKGSALRFDKIVELCELAPEQMATTLSTSISATVPHMTSMSDDVCDSAKAALVALCTTCPNPDMEPFIPELVEAIADDKNIADTVFKIASTTFVAEVEGASLSIMEPILKTGLSTTASIPTKRSCARIIENMTKLVDEPRYLASFIPQIGPLLAAAKVDVSDKECRGVCAQADAALQKKAAAAVPLTFTATKALEMLKTALPTLAAKKELAFSFEIVASMCGLQNEINSLAEKAWVQSIAPAMVSLFGMSESDAIPVLRTINEEANKSRVVVEEEEVEDDAEVLTDLPFGLAYGNKVLLRKTRLKLLRGHRYGLLGQNDSGKTSLLNALADYKIEGFPTADECRTVFVATDIKTELADLTVLDYMFHDPLLKECGASRDDMEKMLNSVGFKEGANANTTQKVGTLSGGWRMKLALSRAMLLNADILLLDEPTNHLDAYNVKWVESYLLGLKDVTCIMVSHDSGLLTRVCNNIIEIDEMKLNYFRGNLDEFVAKKPEAKCYFELAEKGKIDFNFPPPGTLEGVNSKGKAILKMTNITFTYPGVEKAQLNNVTIALSLASRVACVGENGAGKSTMIKLLTGELMPDEGSGAVYKHPNCRVGYIAQHAFHHIEKHLDLTANEYYRWRYANGGDREETTKVTNIASEEELKMMAQPIMFKFEQLDGTFLKQKKVVSRFTERRRNNKKDRTVEYEAELVNYEGNHWCEKELLIENGFKTVLTKLDETIAIRAASFQRPLTKENVQQQMADVGLAPEFSTHMRMGALSGGQKVKVVLGAALWNCPHILILDEPTNYLDRESLGALARAIRKFEGGVVMITHNSQFCDNLCPVVWHLQNNTLDIKGDAEWMAEAGKTKIEAAAAPDEMVDAMGNIVKIKKKKKLTKKEIKQKKMRRARRIRELGAEGDYDSAEDDSDYEE